MIGAAPWRVVRSRLALDVPWYRVRCDTLALAPCMTDQIGGGSARTICGRWRESVASHSLPRGRFGLHVSPKWHLAPRAADLRALADAGAAGALVATAIHGGAIGAEDLRAFR